MNPAMRPPMMPLGAQTGVQTGSSPWMYARQGWAGAPWQPQTPMTGTNTPWHMLEARDRLWWHDRGSFDPADVCWKRRPEDSDEEIGKDKQPEFQPDLGPNRMPPTVADVQPPPEWFGYMQGMRRSGPAHPWLAYSSEDLDAPVDPRYSKLYNRNQQSSSAVAGRRGESSNYRSPSV
jgi:hypothetical protein